MFIFFNQSCTKDNTSEMLETFQDYSDTVIAIGISHLARNAQIFDTADLAVGVDAIDEDMSHHNADTCEAAAQHFEFALVTALSTSSCVFRFKGAHSTAHMPDIIESGRAAFEACLSSVAFASTGCISFSLFVLFSMCSASTSVPIIPALGSVVYLLLVLPLISLCMATSVGDEESMKEVPPKNDKNLIFGKNERLRVYASAIVRSLLPAIIPQVMWLIAFGELIANLEPEIATEHCNGSTHWTSLVRCEYLKGYSGPARTSASALIFSELVLCVVISSASFLHKTKTIWQEPPWRRNSSWCFSLICSILIVFCFLAVSVDADAPGALPWYFFVIGLVSPFLCIMVNETRKVQNRKHVKRAVVLRRLVSVHRTWNSEYSKLRYTISQSLIYVAI